MVSPRTRLIETVRGVKRDRLRENRERLSEGAGERKAECEAGLRDGQKERRREVQCEVSLSPLPRSSL